MFLKYINSSLLNFKHLTRVGLWRFKELNFILKSLFMSTGKHLPSFT